MKKLLTLFLVVTVLFTLLLLTACGKDDGTTKETTPNETTNPPETTTEAPEEFVEAEHVQNADGVVTVTSLNQKLTMKLTNDADGKIVYSLVNERGEEIVAPSEMGLTATKFDGFKGASITSAAAKELNKSYTYLGNFSQMTDHCVAATVTLSNGGYAFAVEIKLYDNGVAFRYNLPDTDTSRIVRSEETAFRINNIGKVWYGLNSENYESQITSSTYAAINTTAKLTGPLMIELADNKGYVSLLEGYVSDSYVGTNFVSLGENGAFKVSGSWTTGVDFDALTARDEIVTGWRIINYSEDLGDIALNNNIYHSALGMDGDVTVYDDIDWITPGKSVWSWINDRGVPFDPQITYTLNAARLGFTYNIIDEGYYNWDNYEDKLAELGALAKDNNVKQILWAYVSAGHIGYQVTSPASAETVLKKIADLGMSGIKLDFFASETKPITHQLQTATLEAAIANQLIVDFHGVHKPISYAVQYPNELTREGIRGLENMNRGDIITQAKFFTSQFYTRMLAGHADFTPDANTAMQIASLVVMDSPLTVVATNPVDLLANPALEMIRAIPTVWDQSVFLDGAVGSYVSIAKEHDGVWYVGGITSVAQRELTVDLGKFLGDGEYLMTYWKDNTTSIKAVKESVVTKDTIVEVGSLSAGCGYVMQITKLSLSQYGGEIKDPVTIKTASADSVVKYTLDGSDPMTSETAISYTAPITLDKTCTLRVAIVSGDGAGTAMQYNFNKVEYNGIDNQITYASGKTTLTLTPTLANAKVYYTTDGTAPTASSTLYTGPIEVTANTTVKAIAISESGKTSYLKTYNLTVRATVTSITPDVYLGTNYKQAVSGWNNLIRVNKSMNDTTLSLGGASASSGTTFAHGISTNAIGYFVYDIPENATEFVGVAGIDDSTYNNAADGHKASIICRIYIDNQLVYTTQKLGQGDFEQIRVKIPAGAKEIKIEFGDAGDGITCDNADLCDGGFILAE